MSAKSATTSPTSAQALPLVAFVGRPNVGKSSLFNRIVGRRKAIVQDEPGTTRDRNYDLAEWSGHAFRVVDTGGLMGEQLEGPYATPVATQVRQAMDESDAICFVVDVQRRDSLALLKRRARKFEDVRATVLFESHYFRVVPVAS